MMDNEDIEEISETPKKMDIIEDIKETMAFWRNGGLQEDEYGTPMHFQILQCDLLLQIYKKLESIDTSLTSMSNDSWNDHHNH